MGTDRHFLFVDGLEVVSHPMFCRISNLSAKAEYGQKLKTFDSKINADPTAPTHLHAPWVIHFSRVRPEITRFGEGEQSHRGLCILRPELFRRFPLFQCIHEFNARQRV